jgi:hypothetical protein
MLGRVMAANSMFTGTTSNLGQFESGALAWLIGTQPAVLFGGVAAILITLLWVKIFPPLVAVQSVVPEEDPNENPEAAIREGATPKAVMP